MICLPGYCVIYTAVKKYYFLRPCLIPYLPNFIR